MVRPVGIEPTWYCYRGILSPLRMPVPPRPHIKTYFYHYSTGLFHIFQEFSVGSYSYKLDTVVSLCYIFYRFKGRRACRCDSLKSCHGILLELNYWTFSKFCFWQFSVTQHTPRGGCQNCVSCGSGIRTHDFQVMSLASWPLDDPALFIPSVRKTSSAADTSFTE